MPKLKTNKSVRARFKFTRTGIVLRRPSGQDHFLAKRSSKKRRAIRSYVRLSPADMKALRRYMYRSKRSN